MAAGGILASLLIKLGIDARDVQKGAKQVDGIIDRLGGRSAAAGAAVGAAAGVAGIAALRMGDDYKEAFDAIRVGTGATGDQLAGLEASFKTVGGRVQDDIGTTAQVIADLNTRTGQTGEGLEALSRRFLDLSRITKTDAAANVASITRLFGDWSIATEDQSETLDQLFRASQASGIAVDELARQVVSFGAPLRNIGFEFEDAIALLAKWEKEGVNTTLSLGGLKIALGEFAKEGIDAKQGLEDLVDQIVNAEDAAVAMSLGVDRFGSRAGPDMVAAIREGRFEFDAFRDVIKDGSDDIATATQDTEDLGDGFKKLKNRVALAVGPITKDLAGITDTLGSAIFLVPALTGALGRGIGKGLGAEIFPQLGARLAPLAASAGGALGTAFSIAFKAAAVVGIAAVGALIIQEVGKSGRSVIGDLLGTDFSLDDYRDARKGQMEAFAQSMGQSLDDVHQSVIKSMEENGVALDRAAGEFGGLGAEAFEEAYDAAWRQVRMGAGGDSATQAVDALLTSLKADADALANEMSGAGEPMVAGIDDAFDDAVAAVTRGFGNVKQALADPPQLISREERVDNLERRYKRSMEELGKAVDADDPINIRYWTRATDKVKARLERMQGKSETTSDKMGEAFRAAVDTIADLDLTSAGRSLISSWLDGIRGMAERVKSTASNIAGSFASLFRSSSPPKEGPLSTIDKDGAKLIETWLGPMERKKGRVRAVGEAIGGAFQPGGPAMAAVGAVGRGDARGGIHIHVDGNIYGGQSGLRQLAGEIESAVRVSRRERRRVGLAEG